MKRKLILWVTAAVILLIGIAGYSQWQWGAKGSGDETWKVRGGNAQHGRQSITGYGCGACHVINGVGRARGRVGPKLQDIHEQIYLGGVVANTAENSVRWIMFPQKFSPRTAMPNLDVSEQDARDIAAYLYENS